MKNKNAARKKPRFTVLALVIIVGIAFFAFYAASGRLGNDLLLAASLNTQVQAISGDFTCLSPLNAQNISQIQMLEKYPVIGQSLFSPDGSALAVDHHQLGVHVFDLTSKRRMYFQQQLSVTQEWGQEQSTFVFSPDSRFILTYSSSDQNEGGLKIWDIQSASLVRVIEEGASVYAAAMSPDSGSIAFITQTGVYWLDLHQEDSKKEFIGTSARNVLAFNPIRGDEVFFRTTTGFTTFNVQTWKVSTNPAIGIYPHMTISPDGQYLLTWGHNGGIDLWNLETGAHTLDVMASPPWDLVAMNHDKTVLAYSSHNYVTLVDIKTGHNILQFPASSQSGADISLHPTEPLIASLQTGGPLEIWNYITGELIFTLPASKADFSFPLPQGAPQAQFNPQGTLLVLGGKDTEIWGVKDPDCAT